MAKKFTKVLCALLAFVMCLGTVPAFAIDSDVEETSVWNDTTWPITKTANGLDANDQTDVTLTVPGIVEGAIDVVFILGGGMTANMETIESAIEVFRPAMESGKANVRMGLISLEKGKEIILDLNSDEAVLDPDTYVEFVTEKFNSINDLPGGSTNLHSQMLEAQKMLAAEKEAKPENKFVFVLATGRTYWFDDANGEQVTIINTVKGTDKKTYYYWGDYLWRSQRNQNSSSLYMVPDRYNNDYSLFLEDIEKWVKADKDTYVFNPHFDANDYGAYATWYANNNKDLRTLGVSNSRYGMAIINPAPTADNFSTGIIAAIGSGSNPQNALNYERAQYECIQVWKELVASGYHCYSICSEAPKYQNYSENITEIAQYSGTSRIQVGHAFMDYLAMLAGQGSAPVVWDYERDAKGNMLSTKTVIRENFFSSISEDMLYTTSIGTTVVDYIGKNKNGNFEFIENAEYIKLVVGGVPYITSVATTAKHIDENGEKAKSSYAFYHPWNPAEPTFWLDYYYGDGETTERFVWTFGEDVSMKNLASLTYKLQLTEKLETEGIHKVPTNNSATLYPVDSDGKEGKPQVFPIPEVEYEVVPYDVDIVLALGAGIAQYDNTYNSIVSLVEPLVTDGINVKLGLIAVEHYDDVALPLTVLTKDNYKKVITDGLNKIQSMPAGPTNLHGNIVAAKEMLDADDTVPAANKFFYVIATGRTYNYDNADGVPTTIVNKVSLKGNTYYYWGHYLWQSQRGRHTSLYRVPTSYENNFAKYWADVESWVAADGDTYAYSFTDAYDVSNPQWFNTFYNANNKDAKALGLASSRFGWIMNPLTNSGHAGITSGNNPANALSYERAQYEAYYAYKAMVDAGYICKAICSEQVEYQNYSPYMEYLGEKRSIQLGHSFMDHMAKLSGQDEATLLFNLIDNNGNYKMAENFFAPIVTEDLEKSGEALGSSTLSLRNSAAKNAVASVSVDAEGDALTYEWYYKNQGSDEFTLSSFTGADFRAVMSSDYDGMQVYCVITDQYGNSTTTEVVTLNLD